MAGDTWRCSGLAESFIAGFLLQPRAWSSDFLAFKHCPTCPPHALVPCITEQPPSANHRHLLHLPGGTAFLRSYTFSSHWLALLAISPYVDQKTYHILVLIPAVGVAVRSWCGCPQLVRLSAVGAAVALPHPIRRGSSATAAPTTRPQTSGPVLIKNNN